MGAREGSTMLWIYALTAFGCGLLLFFVQPMFARMVLPLLGGTPAVWNTTQVFCEGCLLAGYLYAYASTRWLKSHIQIILHMAIMLGALFVLPIGMPLELAPPVNSNPTIWLLLLLTTAIGLPFLVLSGSSPLLQKWFSRSGHRHSLDPYFLYAASNMGSMAALVFYPALAEPWLRLRDQSKVWTTGYYLLIVLTGLCALYLWKSKYERDSRKPVAEDNSKREFWRDNKRDCAPVPSLSNARRLRWLLLAFVPCSLMLSVTTYLTTDIASVPLLWVIPLGLYLLSFILVFARKRLIPHPVMLKLMPLLVVPLVVALASRGSDPIGISIPLHLAAFFLIAMVCHGELAQDRPPVVHLTEFYLFLSAGGFLGGIFNALIAPVIFKSVAEYPIVVILACLLLPSVKRELRDLRHWIMDFVFPLLLTSGALWLVFMTRRIDLTPGPLANAIMFGIPAIVSYSFSRRPLRFALAVGGILWASSYYYGAQGRVLYSERSFFGVSRVTLDDEGKFYKFMNGTTLHGSQALDSRHRMEATSYYHRTGPLGQFFKALASDERMHRIAIIGLGVGEIAAYGKAGQHWTYYEIDPAVLRIARDGEYFTYLRDCPASLNVVLGDGRLKLADAPDGSYDVLILDAYSSDSVPVHLLDREALQLYLKKTTKRGVLLFHISNRYLDLEPVIGNLAMDAGLIALSQSDSTISPAEAEDGKKPSGYIILRRSPMDLAPLQTDPRWVPARTDPDIGVWTDDFSSILSVMRWGMP